MKFQLVLQFMASSAREFDQLIDLEDKLERRLKGTAEVDGHDFGSEEMNIFILTDDPIAIFDKAKRILEGNRLWGKMKAAYRPIDGNNYTCLWPEGSTSDFEIR